MGKTFNVSVVIGAAFAGSFKTTIGGAMKQMDAMGSAIRKMESTRVDIDSFKKLKHDLDASKSSLAEAQASVGKLAREMKTADQAVAALGGDLKSAKESSIASPPASRELNDRPMR